MAVCGGAADGPLTILEQGNESMRSTVWLMIVFFASGVSGDARRLLADTGPPATPSLAQQSSATRTAPPPDLRAFPKAPAPGELATVRFPETERTVSALIQR